MPRVIRPTLFALLVANLVVGCATPTLIQSTSVPTQPAPIRPAPTPTQPEPIQPAPTQSAPTSTSTLGILGVQVSIPVGEGTETLNATITGNGDVAIIIANSLGNDPSRWAPLVEALGSNANLRIVTFAYRSDNEDTHVTDTIAVFDYLRAERIGKIICIGAGFGSTACAGLQKKPEIIGMVFFATNASAIDANFPKLFLTADADPFGLAGSTERAYQQSAEPKIFKSYVAGVHGVALFSKADVGPQVLADVTEFINGIVSGQ